jgi:hypothetical protein
VPFYESRGHRLRLPPYFFYESNQESFDWIIIPLSITKIPGNLWIETA